MRAQVLPTLAPIVRKIAFALVLAFVATVLVACSGGSGTTSGGNDGMTSPGSGKSWAGIDPAPPFPEGLSWFNVAAPLTLDSLRGKVVVLDFWTLGCINCQHVIPDLDQLEEEFGDALAVIGVHSGKYETEHEDESIREAVRRYGLKHPVVNDPEFVFWNRFGARAWPTLVIIDPAGNLVGYHAGEGVYPLFQPIIDSLIAEFDARGTLDTSPLPLQLDASTAATVLSYPGDVAVDEVRSRLYIADSGHNRILVATLDGALEQVIGDGEEGFADGAAGEARFRQPQGIGLSADGATLFVADTRNHAVRAVDTASGEVTTIAGTGKQLDRLPPVDAKAAETALASPWDVVEADGALFISMAGVHQIWRLDLATLRIEPFAGTSREGVDDGDRRTMATLAQPSGITSDGTYIYWVDPEGSAVRRVIVDGSGPVESLVGTGLFDFGDVDGDRMSARLQHPQGLAVDGSRLIVSDTYNHRLKSVDAREGGSLHFSGAGRGFEDGLAPFTQFDEPGGIAIARDLAFVADTNNHAVRIVALSDGHTRTLALTNLAVATQNAPGRDARIDLPEVEAAPGASTLRFTLSTPPGYHLNSLAPGRLVLASSDTSVLDLSERDLAWESDDGSVTFPVPVQLAEGSATLTASLHAYYCREGEEALCFIQRVELVLPVRVTAGSTAGEIPLVYELPPETP